MPRRAQQSVTLVTRIVIFEKRGVKRMRAGRVDGGCRLPHDILYTVSLPNEDTRFINQKQSKS